MDSGTTDLDDDLSITSGGRVCRVSLKRLEDSMEFFLKQCREINTETEEDPIVDVWESGVFPDD